MKTTARMTTAERMNKVTAISLTVALAIYFVLPVTALSQTSLALWVGTRSQTNAAEQVNNPGEPLQTFTVTNLNDSGASGRPSLTPTLVPVTTRLSFN